MITTILFDLDGTLLPMNQDDFANAYVRGLATAAVPAGYEPQTFSKAIITGTYAMVKNNGIGTNEDVFWNTVTKSSRIYIFLMNFIVRISKRFNRSAVMNPKQKN